MTQIDRIPDKLFTGDGHYLGKPAEYTDKIITRRVDLVKAIPLFTDLNKSLLEIGCGNGESMFLLHDLFNECVGLEVTSEHHASFEQRREQLGIDNCSYHILNIEEHEPPKVFDRIISFEVIEHLEHEDSLTFYHKALADDGLMAISVPNKWWIFETHGAKLPLLPWNRVPFFSWLPTPIHERYANARIYTQQRIRDLLIKHGFEVMDMKYIMAPMDVLPDGKLKQLVVKTFFNNETTTNPFKSTSIFVVARKKKS